VNCSDATLGLDGPQPCVGMTVDLFGAIWLAGRKAGPKYSLIKIVDKAKITQGCTTGAWTALAGNANLCANEYVANRPLFTDLDSIDGDVAEAFDDFGSGVLAVENGTSTVFFPDVDDASPNPDPNFGSWGLASGEKLLSTSLLQVPVGPETTEVTNYILAVTNTGRVLSKAALAPAATQQVLDLTPSSPIEIDQASWTASSCLDAQTCNVAGATLTAAGGTNPTLVQKLFNGAYGLAVRGGAGGDEIGADEQLGVQFPDGSTVTAIKVLFLYNGDEFGDFRE
jgi:hypothetical protein